LSRPQILVPVAGVFSRHHDHALLALHQRMSMRECDSKVEAPHV
jgi:hypothetical protein